MGWLWGNSSNSGSGNTTNSDPLSKLDPTLREFLEKESPAKYRPPAASPTQPATGSTEALLTEANKVGDSIAPVVPTESLYQDGRYAHLWKNYKPLSVIEAEGQTEQDKLRDIIEAYNDRRAAIGRAALENCTLEQMAVNDCFRSGSWSARMTMCREDNRKLERCYTMQGKFLKALGYLSINGRSPEEEERIQMHADTLYHRMLDHERLVEEAKKAGIPAPELPSMISKENISAAMRGKHFVHERVEASVLPEGLTESRSPFTLEGLPEKARKELEKRFEGKSGSERALEEQAVRAELAAGKAVADEIENVYEQERKGRLSRREQGKETVGDTVKRWWGW